MSDKTFTFTQDELVDLLGGLTVGLVLLQEKKGDHYRQSEKELERLYAMIGERRPSDINKKP